MGLCGHSTNGEFYARRVKKNDNLNSHTGKDHPGTSVDEREGGPGLIPQTSQI